MNDVDRLLRDAGASQRATAPTATETEAALHSLADVRLDDRATHRNRRWMIGPAVVLAAAAAAVGVVVLIRPEESAVVPVDTISSATTTTTTTTIVEEAGVRLADGVLLEMANVDFDGDGGACLTLSTPSESAAGCASGPLMRTAFGQPLWLRLGDTPYWLFPTGLRGTGEPELLSAENTPTACSTASAPRGALVEVAGCDSTFPGILGVLPAAPDGDVVWAQVSSDGGAAGTDLALVTASADLGARVFRTPAEQPACTIVTARDNSVREYCGAGGTSTFLAGSADAPLVVSADSAAGTATVDAIPSGRTLAINGCADLTASDLLGLLPEHGVAGFLLCRADVGAVWVAPTVTNPRFAETAWDVLQRGDDGTWSVAAAEVDYTCVDGIAAETCAELGLLDLAGSPPFPSATSIAAFDQAVGGVATLPGRSADEEILPLVAPAADLPALAEAIAAAMLEAQGGDGTVEVVAGESSPIIIRRSNLDDSVTATIFVLNAARIDTGEVVVFSRGNRAFDICGRGTTTVDGEPACV